MASPEEIYLQWYDENGEEPQDGSEVTWCQDRINDTDVRYVKLSFITAIQEKLSKDESEIAELTSTCSQCKEPAWCETKAENKRLTKELAEAEADADRLAKELHDWLVFAEANDQIYAAISGMNAMLHHQKRKEGK